MDKLIDMKRSTPDEESGEYAVPASPSGEQYPYGLQITLRSEELAKFGVTDMPAVGSEIHGSFAGMVTSARQEAGEDGDKRMTVQIMYLAMQAEKPHPGEGKETAADESRENSKPAMFKPLSKPATIVS